jgi:hypothetical protein
LVWLFWKWGELLAQALSLSIGMSHQCPACVSSWGCNFLTFSQFFLGSIELRASHLLAGPGATGQPFLVMGRPSPCTPPPCPALPQIGSQELFAWGCL